MSDSLYWYDYETFGTDPRRDRVAQFAGIRTDADLNIISEPLTLYCKQANDFLPDPYACMVTGITPQLANERGLTENEFIARIHQEFSTPGTCVAGYNNLRFDDEFTRNLLYRNFFDAYAHEWQHGNSRWDLIDIVRLTRALRPEGIVWPEDDGRPSLRLELLTAANGISHEAAHDAMSDVYATISMAKLIRDRQPRLFDYMYGLRRKQTVVKQFDLRQREAVLHVSSRYSAERHAIAMVMPLCMHPSNKNGVIVYDLATPPDDVLSLSAEQIEERLYTRSEDLPEGVARIPLKVVHLNKCPVVVPLKTMDEATAQRLGIDVDTQLEHRQRLLTDIASLTSKSQQVFGNNRFDDPTDPDLMIYSGGFFSDDDRRRMTKIRAAAPEELADLEPAFDDRRLHEMLFRYRARNYPETLDDIESERWMEFCTGRLGGEDAGTRGRESFDEAIATLRQGDSITDAQSKVLEELERYSASLP